MQPRWRTLLPVVWVPMPCDNYLARVCSTLRTRFGITCRISSLMIARDWAAAAFSHSHVCRSPIHTTLSASGAFRTRRATLSGRAMLRLPSPVSLAWREACQVRRIKFVGEWCQCLLVGRRWRRSRFVAIRGQSWISHLEKERREEWVGCWRRLMGNVDTVVCDSYLWSCSM